LHWLIFSERPGSVDPEQTDAAAGRETATESPAA